MGLKSQRKGKTFQNQVNKLLSEAFQTLVVTNPSQVGDDAGRDHLLMLPFCIQSQHVAKGIDPYGKLAEAKSAAREGEYAVAIIKQDYKPILAVMSLGDWVELVKKAYGG